MEFKSILHLIKQHCRSSAPSSSVQSIVAVFDNCCRSRKSCAASIAYAGELMPRFPLKCRDIHYQVHRHHKYPLQQHNRSVRTTVLHPSLLTFHSNDEIDPFTIGTITVRLLLLDTVAGIVGRQLLR